MKLNFVLLFILSLLSFSTVHAQSGSFIVKGDINTYYPVTFSDGGYSVNFATELELGRSDVHKDASWRGALIAKFRYHTTNYGNGAAFINADIQDNLVDFCVIKNFVGGYSDVTSNNGDMKIVIWLRGGTTTYYYKANYTVSPSVYDGVQSTNTYYQETGGPRRDAKTSPDAYVNPIGASFNSPFYANNIVVNKTGATVNQNYKLDVNGAARANKVVVNTTGADFVFDSSYNLQSLDKVKSFINEHHHLPDIQPAAEMQKDGIDLGSNQTKLLQKIEELTLYLIEQNKKIEKIQKELEELKNKNDSYNRPANN